MKIKLGQRPKSGDLFFDFPHRGSSHSGKAGNFAHRIKIGLGIGLITAAVTGCVGVVGDDGYGYGDGVVVAPEPDVYFFGDYGGRHDWHDYSHRGSTSRGAAHPGGGHPSGGGHPPSGGHAGGGGHGGRH